MIARTLFSLLNLVAMVVTIVAWFTLPQYAVYILYAFIAWMVVGFIVLTSSWGSRAVGAGSRGPGSATAPGGAPLPSGAGSTAHAPAPVGFCVYCATDLPPGATHCPACHRAVMPL